MKRPIRIALTGVCLLAGRAAAEGAALAAGTEAAAAPVGEITRLLQFAGNAFSGVGAPFMWAILLVSAFAVTVAAEKAFFLIRASRGDRDLFDHVARLVKEQRMEEARAVAERSRTPFGRVARSVLGIRHGHRQEEMQNRLDEAYLGEIPLVHRRIPLLAVSANIATLLGLLGTIVGLIMAFDALANVPAAQRTAALAAGISVAMATTGLGLVVA
ncbi:MAG: MotA/TolQ/ExbB proton channel family protein, partial [Candidatus Eisenbacteria bacterium]